MRRESTLRQVNGRMYYDFNRYWEAAGGVRLTMPLYRLSESPKLTVRGSGGLNPDRDREHDDFSRTHLFREWVKSEDLWNWLESDINE